MYTLHVRSSLSDVHDQRYKRPFPIPFVTLDNNVSDIPSMVPSDPCDTQNFENAFLRMKPVINDEINADTV